MNKFVVYCDPEGMKELCDLSPYNLKKDLKNISEDELKGKDDKISKRAGNQLRELVEEYLIALGDL